MRVIGTAGHVDHGKSTLVYALTGIDPDRLREEKAREMTIDLGFAWLTLPNGEAVGVVDVPGHIDFIKNMLAGIGSIDAALFVVAADEGVMPQTREHLAILDLIGVPAGVVALTKIDTISEEGWLELVEADVRETLAGTCLTDVPIVPVSSRTGAGLDDLKQALADVLAHMPPRRNRGLPRLPIDRTFSVAGFGTVVTGTLSDGSFEIGDEVEIVPGSIRARIRSLQTHKQPVQVGLPGSRLAINLTGVHPDQLARGMVVARPGSLRPTRLVDVRLRLLMQDNIAPLRHNQAVDFYTGAAQVPAHVRVLGAEEILPGESGWVQIRLAEPVALVAGDRFIIRQPSPSMTLGGGQVVNPHPRRRWRRFQTEVIAQLEALARGTPEDLILHALATREPEQLRVVAEESGLDADTAERTLAAMIKRGAIHPLGNAQPPLRNSNTLAISLGGWQTLALQMRELLAGYHMQYPLRPGIPREEFKSRLQGRSKWSARLFNELLALGKGEGLLEEAGDYVRQPGHEIAFGEKEQAQVDALLELFRRQPNTPPSMADCLAQTSQEILNALLYQRVLVRVSEDVLFDRETYESMVQQVVAFIQQHGSMTVAQVRDALNTSRKYALALMEHLDERRITRRVGDARVLR